MKRTTTKTTRKATTPVVAPATPAKLAPCNVDALIAHYRHQLHRHLVDRGDNEAAALLFTIATLEGVQADQGAA